MKWFERRKVSHEIKQVAINVIDTEITAQMTAPDIDADRVHELIKKRRDIKMNGVDAGDILKVVANVAVVMVLVGFEMGNILNQKGSRFIKTL